MTGRGAGVGQQVADLIANVLQQHAQWSGPLTEEARSAARNAFLEGMETHGADVAGPLVDSIRQAASIPPEVSALLGEVAEPGQQFSALIQQFFIFGVMFNLANTLLAPFTQIVANEVWQVNPDRPISPPDAADMVVRGLLDQATAEGIAAQSGINATAFDLMVRDTGEPPANELLFEAIRRGIIDEGTLELGIRQSRIKDEWISTVAALRYVIPSPADFVRAAVQEQMDYSDADSWAQVAGLEPAGYQNDNPDWFRLLYDTAGRPPGPQEVGRMALRGIVGWTGTGPDETTFAQAIAESDVKTKWTDALAALQQYVPPASEVTTLLKADAITTDQANALYQQDGLSPELAAAFTFRAMHELVATDKELTKGEVLELYVAQAMSYDDAAAALDLVGYRGDIAAYLLALAELRRVQRELQSVIGELGRQVVTGKTSLANAQSSLQALGIPQAQADALLSQWTIAHNAQAPLPTGAQIASGFYYGVLNQDEAMSLLEALGYAPYWAWFTLSVRAHGPLPNMPAPTGF